MLGFAYGAAPEGRQGSLLRAKDGTIVGSRLLAQKFERPEYFWPRPSACNYDASSTGGSNLSPTNPELTKQAQEIIARLQPEAGKLVPPDLVSASGSGMDPHITLAAAKLQIVRVAAARKLPAEKVDQLVTDHAESPTFAAFGAELLVNVLELNVALDELSPKP
jgi:K+-transporting ATPase ATPase C chain